MKPTGRGKKVIVNNRQTIVGVFDSVSEMCRELHFDRRAVMRCLGNKTGFRTVLGHWFEYPNPDYKETDYVKGEINPKFKSTNNIE
ncbi:MAG: hypothetical protein ACRC6V_06940 [Bacteroidales bacterium]